MIDIGILGLDTSHPESFAEILGRRSDVNISAIWDSGVIRTAADASSFCDTHDATLYDNPIEMVDTVDAAMVLTANWDTHLALARPFLEAQVPTFVDKPLAGNATEVAAFADLVGKTVPLFGGSAVPFHPAITSLPKRYSKRTLFAAGYNDYFYYRVHLSDTVRYVAGSDWTCVEPMDGPGSTVRIHFEDGARAMLRFDGSTEEATFGILDIADCTQTIQISVNEDSLVSMYEPFIDAFLATIRGNRDDTDRVLDSAHLILAIEAAFDAGKTVTPNSEPSTNVDRDGDLFIENYEPYY